MREHGLIAAAWVRRELVLHRSHQPQRHGAHFGRQPDLPNPARVNPDPERRSPVVSEGAQALYACAVIAVEGLDRPRPYFSAEVIVVVYPLVNDPEEENRPMRRLWAGIALSCIPPAHYRNSNETPARAVSGRNIMPIYHWQRSIARRDKPAASSAEPLGALRLGQ